MITPDRIMDEMMRLSGAIDDLLAELLTVAQDIPQAHRDYRDAYTTRFLSSEGAVKLKEMIAEQHCLDLRLEHDKMYAMEAFLKNAISARKQQMSALQTIASGVRSEIEMAKYGPQMGA